MKFTANNNYSDSTQVTLDYTLAEEEDMELGICSTASGLAQVIIELLKRTCETLQQAEILMDIVTDRMQNEVKEYIRNGLAKEIDMKQQKKLYQYMQEVFYRWLHDSANKLPIERWKAKYRGSTDLKMESVLVADTGMIAIILTNGEIGDLLVELDPKNRGTESFKHALSEAFIISTVAGDLICGQENNPIRKLPVGENADGDLSESIERLISNQQKEDENV